MTNDNFARFVHTHTHIRIHTHIHIHTHMFMSENFSWRYATIVIVSRLVTIVITPWDCCVAARFTANEHRRSPGAMLSSLLSDCNVLGCEDEDCCLRQSRLHTKANVYPLHSLHRLCDLPIRIDYFYWNLEFCCGHGKVQYIYIIHHLSQIF